MRTNDELVALVASVAAVFAPPPRQPDGADLSVVFDVVKVSKNATLSSATVPRMKENGL